MSKPLSYDILGIGDACIDVLIPVSEEFLAQIPGEKGGSQQIGNEELTHILAASPSAPLIAAGGSCANTIKGLAGLKQKCAFLSYTGRDAFGDHFLYNLKKWGIHGLFANARLPTSVVLCLITPDGQRTMRFFSPSSTEMPDDFLHADHFKGVRHVHLDAYTLRRGHLTEQSIKHAKAVQATLSIDLSSFEIVKEYEERIWALLPEIDIVFSNEKETKQLIGLEPFEACLKLQEIIPIPVILRGAKGCLVGYDGNVLESPAFITKVVDTTGAGDLFASGFLHGFLQSHPLDKCARLGNRLGSAVVEIAGAELPLERWEMLKEFIKTEGLSF